MSIIYVQLLDEGTTTYRPAEGVDQGSNVFYVLPTPTYDPNVESWEFPPGSLVVCERVGEAGESFLLAKRLYATGEPQL
jgi:hypothetical protein